jgi:hypothetical protein
MTVLSEHFTRAEFACPVSGLCRVSNRLLGALERLRKISGGRRIFISRGGGCRSWSYNQELVERKGAGQKSEHLIQGESSPAEKATRDCRAADIHIEGLTVPEMYWLALSVPDFGHGGIGVYPQNGFVHVDVREGEARWMWKDGQQVAIPKGFESEPGAPPAVDMSPYAAALDRARMAAALIGSGLEDIGRLIATLQKEVEDAEK